MKFRLRHMSTRIAATFRKKPVEIQAERIEEEQYVDTLEGRMRGNPGDWKVKGVKGEEYFVAGDIFPETYEPVDDEAKAEWERAYDEDFEG